MQSDYELQGFMKEMNQEVASDYAMIRRRAVEDPGTAGDRAEETWATLLRDWLPPSMPIVTRGRILSTTGASSRQADILILHPDYPPRLRRRKVFLSAGVLAAFECKLTLKRAHIADTFRLSHSIKSLEPRRIGTPGEELRSRIFVGLLAHSHTRLRSRENPLSAALSRALDESEHPSFLPDIMTVADLGTATLQHMAWVGDAARDAEPVDRGLVAQLPGGQGIESRYIFHGLGTNVHPPGHDLASDEEAAILGSLVSELFGALRVAGIGDFLDLVDLEGWGHSVASKCWPTAVLSASGLRRALKDAKTAPHAY